MKNRAIKVSPLILALGAAGFSVPSMAQMSAEGTIGVANMYLWRGQNVTPDGGQVQGGIGLSAPSGIYGGIWASSETGGHETDLYAGWGGSFGPVGVDVSYWYYMYPEDSNPASSAAGAPTSYDLGDNSLSDVVVSLSYAFNDDFSASVAGYIQASAMSGAAENADENNYYTITGTYKKVSVTYGFWDLETPATAANGYGGSGDEYSHIQIDYAATEGLSFGVSIASSDIGQENGGVEEDPLFKVAYDWSFDLMK